MHPAWSIILFTTLSAHGYGLAAMLGVGILDPAALSTRLGHGIALALISAGLLSSTAHLHHPRRAWRAVSQWRSSWLSREGLLAILAFIPIGANAWFGMVEARHFFPVGVTAALMSIATVHATAMIYASLRAVPAWYTPLTPITFLLSAGAGGALLASMLAAFSGNPPLAPGLLAALFLPAAWYAKRRWRARMHASDSSPETATGLGHIGRVRQIASPHGNDNYLTREMGFRVARKHAVRLARISRLLTFPLPLLLLASSIALAKAPVLAGLTAGLTVLSHGLGLLVERWLFFAEARHAVMNYYSRW